MNSTRSCIFIDVLNDHSKAWTCHKYFQLFTIDLVFVPNLSFGTIIANAYVWYINFKLWCKPICLQDVLYTYIYYHIILIPLRQFILSFPECNLFIVLTNVETSSLIKTAIYIILNDGNWLYIKCSSWLCSICTEYAIINAIRAFSSKRRKVNIIAFLEDKMCPKIELLLI